MLDKSNPSTESVLENANLTLAQKGFPLIIDVPKDATYDEKKFSLSSRVIEGIVLVQQWFMECIRKEISFGLPFLLILVFCVVGAIFYFNLDKEPSWEQFVALIILLFGLLYGARNYYSVWLIVCFLCCIVLGALFAKIETWRMSTPMLSSNISTTLTGRVVSVEALEKGGFYVIVDVLKTEKPILRHSPDRVRLTAKYLPSKLSPGDGLYGRVRLHALSGAMRPGGYDFSFHNYFKGIGAYGTYLGQPIKISVFQPGALLARTSQKIENLRMEMTLRISAAIDGENGKVSSALITGQRGGISDNTNEALRTSGLAHILSISGLHMALLSGIVFIFIRVFFAFFPVFSSHYSTKKIAAIAALIIAAFYLALSGASVSAQRSFVMVATMLIAILCNRSGITMRSFAIAALVVIAISPHEILGPSFQMSFSATAALIAAFEWWAKRRSSDVKKTIPSSIGAKVFRFIFLSVVSICSSSLIAGSASGIYAAHHFTNVASLSVISNVLALPIVSILVMPFGLVAVLAMTLGLEWFPLQIMGFGIGLVIKIAYMIASISPTFNPGFIPSSALIFLSLGLTGLIFFKTPLRFIFAIPIIAGVLIYGICSSVQLIVSDGMNLVGVINKKTLYIDKSRASKFTISQWKRLFDVDEIIKPTRSGPTLNGQFICDDNVCTSLPKDGLRVSILRRKTSQCIKVDVVIKESTVDDRVCVQISGIMITPQQLLSRGSVMVTRNKVVMWSSVGFHRPWSMHRQDLEKLGI
ncbi:ComEC/Rec2 family competence protein [Bartonella ancashensis]|uniref:ComEC/Rec2 family competence protein n=1 Tax=Bartonella ancashensis TaxID=1318743 RepID=UPI0039E40348